jgi:hypothetical protein
MTSPRKGQMAIGHRAITSSMEQDQTRRGVGDEGGRGAAVRGRQGVVRSCCGAEVLGWVDATTAANTGLALPIGRAVSTVGQSAVMVADIDVSSASGSVVWQ